MNERDLSFADTAPIRIEAATTVAATREQVWQVLVDHRGWPSWFGPSLVSCEPTSTPEHGVGSTRTVRLRGGASVDERFIAWDEPELWAFTGLTGPPVWKALVERATLVPVDGGTQVTYRMAIEPARGCGWLVNLMGGGVRKAVGQALENLGPEIARRRAPADNS